MSATPGVQLNGLPLAEIVVMPPEVVANVQAIFAQGQALGRDPRAFSRLGSSQIATSHFLTRFDTPYYNLGDYAFLQPAIDYYEGSFHRYGVAIKVGLHAASALDPPPDPRRWCEPDEDMVSCELRLHNPAILLILLGTNDSDSQLSFENSMAGIIELTVGAGVIPLLVTKADRFEGPDNRNNDVMRRLAAAYAIPLCDFDRLAGTLPERGLADDEVHLTFYPSHDYRAAEAFERGYSMLNLAVLLALDGIRQAVAG
jgi:hypothetical protein